MQNDLNELFNWSKIWSTELNLLKCKTIYIGKNREKCPYAVGNVNLKETSEEKDLGVFVTNDLKWNRQCSAAAAKANRVLGQIRNSFLCLEEETLRLLYTGLVRPHLEYAISMWNPSTRTNINLIEKVQRRATKLVKSIKKETYEDRLKSLGLMNLEDRRMRGDLIQMYKIVNGIEKINLVNGVNFAKSLNLNLRRKNDKRLTRELSKCGSHRYKFLTNRVVAKWNELPQSVVDAESINMFKSHIDREMFGMVKRRKRKTAKALSELNA